ncbi:MAG TPA: SymE family type I addiction module toxin [Noviherbaspirillum sp.]|nr:SymE family type I addiction module toxin [Noviherbaspirillum sp.]
MARRNHTRDEPAPQGSKHERFLTVSLYPEAILRMPWIRLRGQWLQQAGFVPQARVRVRIMQGCLVITTE